MPHRNPQKDIQAMGRVHRIGQTRVVHIYRFVTSGSVEERILQRQQQKLYLDSCVIRGSTAISQAIDDQELIEGDADAPEDEEPVIKPSAVMEVLPNPPSRLVSHHAPLAGLEVWLELRVHARRVQRWSVRCIPSDCRSFD